MVTSSEWVDKLCAFEGLRLKAYKCPAGKWTIGYGHTGADVKEGMIISEERARGLLVMDLMKFEDGVKAAVGGYQLARMTQHQFDALVDFAFNCGLGNLHASTLLRKVRISLDNPTIKDEFMKWNKGRVNGRLVPLAGLTKRRREEAEWYFS